MDEINNLFTQLFSDLKCRKDTQAYIVSIFNKYKNPYHDLSKNNITLLFAKAREEHNFSLYQNIGDWIFFINTWAPNHFKFSHKDYYDNLARLSYYSCYKLINKKWYLFEELSDNLIILEDQVKYKLNNINI